MVPQRPFSQFGDPPAKLADRTADAVDNKCLFSMEQNANMIYRLYYIYIDWMIYIYILYYIFIIYIILINDI